MNMEFIIQRNVRNDFTSVSFFGIILPLYLDNLIIAVLCLYSYSMNLHTPKIGDSVDKFAFLIKHKENRNIGLSIFNLYLILRGPNGKRR